MKNKIIEIYKKIASSKVFLKIKTFAIVHKIWFGIISLAIIGLLIFTFSKVFAQGSTTQYTFGRVARGDLVVSVSGSGQVATLSKVSIKPNTTGQSQTLGQIISVKVQNGDTVKAGQVVAILDGKNALQTLNQAQATYNKLVKGLSDASLLSLNNSITSAQTSLDNSKQNILIALKNAYTSASNAVYINTDSFFNDPSTNPVLSIDGVNFNNQTLVNNIEQERSSINSILINWSDKIKTQITSDDLATSINQSISDLNTIRNYFDDMTNLFALYSNASASGQSALNSAKSAASGARGSMDSSISSLTSTLQSYNNNIFQLKNTKDNLNVQQEPPSADDLAVSKANLTNAQIAYASRIITAPFDGQIGGLSASIGQQVSSGDSLGTLITAEKVINVTLNEVDAAKISAGNPVTITYDSLPNLTMTGKVSYVDPLGTVTSGVVSYSVQISMDTQNPQVKTGMTASVAIVTTQHQNVLTIPTSAITTTSGKKYVLVADVSSSTMSGQFGNMNGASSTRNFSSTTRRNFASSTFASSTSGTSSKQFGNGNSSTMTTQYPVVQVQITTGITNGLNTEVLSGITEGQLIVIKKTAISNTRTTAKSSASSATTNTRAGGFGGGFGGGAVGGITGGGGAAFIRGN